MAGFPARQVRQVLCQHILSLRALFVFDIPSSLAAAPYLPVCDRVRNRIRWSLRCPKRACYAQAAVPHRRCAIGRAATRPFGRLIRHPRFRSVALVGLPRRHNPPHYPQGEPPARNNRYDISLRPPRDAHGSSEQLHRLGVFISQLYTAQTQLLSAPTRFVL